MNKAEPQHKLIISAFFNVLCYKLLNTLLLQDLNVVKWVLEMKWHLAC